MQNNPFVKEKAKCSDLTRFGYSHVMTLDDFLHQSFPAAYLMMADASPQMPHQVPVTWLRIQTKSQYLASRNELIM